jgi:hypothetical protein
LAPAFPGSVGARCIGQNNNRELASKQLQ